MLPITRSMLRTKRLSTTLLICISIAVGTTVTASNGKTSEARQAMTRADALLGDWKEASLRRAIEEYDKAALIWTSISDLKSASHATLKSGEVSFLLSEYTEALKRYQKAEALAQRAGDWLTRAKSLSHIALLQSYLGKNDVAEKQLTKALEIFKRDEVQRSVAAANAYGETLSILAHVSYERGDFVNAFNQLESALKVFKDDPKAEARAHLYMGYITGGLGETGTAVTEISKARDLYRTIDDKAGEALALTALGLAHSRAADHSTAIPMHLQAIEIFRSIGDRHSEAIAFNALGQAYEKLSEFSIALNKYENALRLFQDAGAVDGTSLTTLLIANVYFLSGYEDQALEYYDRGLRLIRAAGKLRTEANALGEIAKIYTSQGKHELALKQYQRVEKFDQSIGDLRGLADASNGSGDSLLQLRQIRRAMKAYNRALSLSEKVGDKAVLVSALYNLARANLKLDAYEAARRLIKRSLDIIEDLRANVASPEYRASYFSAVQKHYELYIAILMQLERLRPGEGFAAEALSVSEHSRARLLLDLVSESRTKIPEGTGNELVERERRLRGLLQAHAEYQMSLSLSRKDSREIADVASQIAELRAEYQAVQAQLRKQNPRLWSLEPFEPLNLQRIQNELRDSDTMLLEFALGDERSYVWAVTSNSFHSYELPARETLEDAARELYKLLTARQQIEGQNSRDYQNHVEVADNLLPEKASKLSEMLLGPLAEQLGSRRLIVVTEGALQLIPLDLLTVAGPGGPKKLIETNEVVMAPSFSTLIASRARKHTSSTSKLVAVIADPILSRSDNRVQSAALSSSSVLAASDKNRDQLLQPGLEIPTPAAGLARLTYASQEADAIAAVAPWNTVFLAKGFDASRETAMRSDVGQYQILHFATHGVLNSEHPELSGVVLTMVDRNGVKTNGVMPLHDIYSLDLSAELTVLSACQTALGREVKGEGLVGLTHSFMSAGSKSVIASLWKVDDRATAALMADFYQSVLQKGMTPGAALRSAKLKMMRDEQWNAPYYWAGFVLQGEYANQIAVDHYSWLRSRLVFLFALIVIAAFLLIFLQRKHRLSSTQST